MVNFSNIAGECGISPPTVREYFQILEDTLTGRFLPSYQKKPERRVILAPKFYYFDPGIAGFSHSHPCPSTELCDLSINKSSIRAVCSSVYQL